MGRVLNNGAVYSSKTGEWYTPDWLLERIDGFFGNNWTDPCPIPTASDRLDAFSYAWRGKIYLNPPYGREVSRWVERLLSSPIDEAILNVAARTDTRWFQPLYDHHILFVRGRLKFNGAKHSAPFPTALVYIGKRPKSFYLAFRDLGRMVCAWEEAD